MLSEKVWPSSLLRGALSIWDLNVPIVEQLDDPMKRLFMTYAGLFKGLTDERGLGENTV